MGWGTGAWGVGPWGYGTAAETACSLASVYAVANRTIRVVLTAPPLAADPLAAHDAINPNTWGVIRLDTNAPVTVLCVTQVSATTFDLSLLEKLADLAVLHQLDASDLYDASGAPIGPAVGTGAGLEMGLGGGIGQQPSGLGPTGPDLTQFIFQGAIHTSEVNDSARQAARRAVSTDFANPVIQASPSPGGTLIAGTHGDYVNVSGADLVRKLIYRRLTTQKGAFFHMPDYGFDLQPKKTYSPAELPTLQARIEQAILLEREVESAQVVITADPADGYITIQIAVKLQSMPQAVMIPPIPIPGAVVA